MCLTDWVLRWLPMCVSKVVLTLQEDDSAKCVPWSIDFSRTPSIPAFQRQRHSRAFQISGPSCLYSETCLFLLLLLLFSSFFF